MRALWVVPCFNEAKRFDALGFTRLVESHDLSVLFVDDGSSDETRSMIEAFVRDQSRAQILALPRNVGKGEAVRRGMMAALESGLDWVGYADADLATPPEELHRLTEVAAHGDADVVLGSRVALAGARIDRKGARHYLGRCFATYASLLLDEKVYDTQCGAKLFRDTPGLRAALAQRFVSRWVFDVELLARLGARRGPGRSPRLLEVPLRRWVDVDGSHIKPTTVPKIAIDVLAATADILRRRRT